MTANLPISNFSIPDDFYCKTFMASKWINGDTISVSPFLPITRTSKDRPSEFAGKYPVNIYHLHKHFIFNEPILRGLLGETNGIFTAIQAQSATFTAATTKSNRQDWVRFSRKYRSAIIACLEKLQEKAAAESEENATAYKNYISVFYSIECIWHLCEIIYIDPSPSDVIVSQLLEWIRFHYPAYQRTAGEYFQGERDADSSPEYWECVRGLVAQGDIPIARALLRLHPEYNTMSFQKADEILKTMPLFQTTSGFSLQKFKSQWQYWIDDTKSKVSMGLDSELKQIIKLTTGDPAAWAKQARESSCWYEFFSGYIFYTQPGCKHFELGTFANNWMLMWKKATGKDLKYLDQIILSVVENNMNEVLRDIQNINDNQWFVTHLTDLLHHSGQIQIMSECNEDAEKNLIDLRASLLFDFGSTLMSHNSLWTMGVDYLEHSSPDGIKAVEFLLPKIPIRNDKQAMGIISAARSKKLPLVETGICRVMASRNMNRNRFGNALEWALRSQDFTLVTSLADAILMNYCKTGEIACEDILSNMELKMFISPRLVFLVEYHDFHKLYMEKKYYEATERLVGMLDSKLTPEYFWPSILADTLPLLESSDLIVSTQRTYIIMQYLEQKLIPLVDHEVKIHGKSLSTDEDNVTVSLQHIFKKYQNIEGLIQMLRLACARNLARSLIIENTAGGAAYLECH